MIPTGCWLRPFQLNQSCYNHYGATMNEPVLVLNANYQPINVTSSYRAINLILAEKATLIMNGRGYIHSVTQRFPLPSVIRLRRMIKRPRPVVKLTRKEIFRRDNYTCQYCQRQLKNLTIDHVIPRHLGGKTNWSNVVTACSRCNHLKGGMTPEQSGMYPRQRPKSPPNSAVYLFGKHLKNNREWKQFLVGW
jgi:5-methylcytosine-specific restriction endonuclease McrA